MLHNILWQMVQKLWGDMSRLRPFWIFSNTKVSPTPIPPYFFGHWSYPYPPKSVQISFLRNVLQMNLGYGNYNSSHCFHDVLLDQLWFDVLCNIGWAIVKGLWIQAKSVVGSNKSSLLWCQKVIKGRNVALFPLINMFLLYVLMWSFARGQHFTHRDNIPTLFQGWINVEDVDPALNQRWGSSSY